MMGFDIIVLNNYPNYRSLQGNPFAFFVFFFVIKMEKGLLHQFIYIQSQWMDSQNLNGV